MDSKRSNAINIGLTVLPPPRTIKTAILNFDEYALNKEGIEVSDGEMEKSYPGQYPYRPAFQLHPILSLPSENPDDDPHRGGEAEDSGGSAGQP